VESSTQATGRRQEQRKDRLGKEQDRRVFVGFYMMKDFFEFFDDMEEERRGGDRSMDYYSKAHGKAIFAALTSTEVPSAEETPRIVSIANRPLRYLIQGGTFALLRFLLTCQDQAVRNSTMALPNDMFRSTCQLHSISTHSKVAYHLRPSRILYRAS
jgi:hypothetical protein